MLKNAYEYIIYNINFKIVRFMLYIIDMLSLISRLNKIQGSACIYVYTASLYLWLPIVNNYKLIGVVFK